MNPILSELLNQAERVVLLGHIHPDGDCIGTCLGLYNYLQEYYPQLHTDLYLDHPNRKFSYLKNFDKIQTEADSEAVYDLCITMDSSDTERLGQYVKFFTSAKKTFCIDHHITNQRFAEENYILPEASSSSEVLYGLLEQKLSREIAECLYTGIVHDTGVFKFSCTSPETMEIAGHLMEAGLDCARIIDDSFYRRTYIQNQILGRALLESILLLDGRCIFSALDQKELELFGASSNDLDGVIDQLRITEGVECAIFIYEKNAQEYKVSMRSNSYVDVSRIAAYFGGGGHVRAAGCTIGGSARDVLNKLLEHLEAQMKEHNRKEQE